MKKCSKCKIEKSLDNFSSNKSNKDGKNNYCKSCDKVRVKRYQENNKSQTLLYLKDWRDNNPDYDKNYTKNNYEKSRNYRKKYQKDRIKNNPDVRLTHNIRTLILISFKNCLKGSYKKGKKTEEILGCTLEEFIQYLQSQFIEGMTLENHGEWEIDHIIPLASAQTEEDIYVLNHYTNLQPLWKEDNRKKSAKILGF
jgi:hypothetical protein